MATEVLMPKLGLTMTEGTIDAWKKNVGDTVQKGEILFSVETDKLTNDVEAEADGVQDHNGRAAIKSAWGLTDADISRLGLNIDETR